MKDCGLYLVHSQQLHKITRTRTELLSSTVHPRRDGREKHTPIHAKYELHAGDIDSSVGHEMAKKSRIC